MKASLCICILGLLGSVCAEESKTDLWMSVSAKVQNLTWRFKATEGAAPDPSIFKGDLAELRSAFDKLVDAQELVRQELLLRAPDERESHKMESVLKFAEALSDTYGAYVAMEMIGFGHHTRFTTFREGKPFKITAYLPPDEMKRYVEHLEKIGLLSESESDKEEK